MKQYYIDKATVAEEIERRKEYYENIHMIKSGYEDNIEDFNELLSFIDNLEVKEVDFERELSKYVSQGIHRFFPNEGNDYYNIDSVEWQDYVIDTAKHFFELGLKARIDKKRVN